MSRIIHLLSMILAFWLIGAANPAAADVFMKHRHYTEGFQMVGVNQPARDTVHTTWYAADRVRRDEDNRSTIARLDKKVVYLLDHAARTYLEWPFNPDAPPIPPKDLPPMEMQLKASVADTGETKKINQWKCRKYIQKLDMGMMPIVSEVWATEDLPMDHGLYGKFNLALYAKQPGMSGDLEAFIKEMKKIRGVPVLTLTTQTMMNLSIKSTQELLEFKEGKAPAGIFDLPEGYKKAVF